MSKKNKSKKVKQPIKKQKENVVKEPKKIREHSRTQTSKNAVKGFFKELKRVRWPNSSVAWKTFWTTLLFIIIAGLVLFLITLGFTTMWEKIGVGL